MNGEIVYRHSIVSYLDIIGFGKFVEDTATPANDVYNILKFMNMVMAGFAFVALSLALIGLFGLAAFMAAQRTKEIGVRKVLGASSAQIARLLVWQFSKPVILTLALFTQTKDLWLALINSKLPKSVNIG